MTRRKRLTRKEKIELFGEGEGKIENLIDIKDLSSIIDESSETKFVPIDPEYLGIEDKKIIKKIVIHLEQDAWDDDFIPPAQYYFVNALGHHIYVRTNKRDTAQEVSNTLYGKDFYRVKRVIRAVVS